MTTIRAARKLLSIVHAVTAWLLTKEKKMIKYLEMVFVPVLLCMGLFAVFGLATL